MSTLNPEDYSAWSTASDQINALGGMICAVPPNSNIPKTFIKFINLVEAVRQKDRLFALDPVDERLLNSFAAVWGTGQFLTASEASMVVPDVAPRSVQRRVAALLEKGMLRIESDASDSRIKYIFPTDKTNEYFAELAKCFAQAKRK